MHVKVWNLFQKDSTIEALLIKTIHLYGTKQKKNSTFSLFNKKFNTYLGWNETMFFKYTADWMEYFLNLKAPYSNCNRFSNCTLTWSFTSFDYKMQKQKLCGKGIERKIRENPNCRQISSKLFSMCVIAFFLFFISFMISTSIFFFFLSFPLNCLSQSVLLWEWSLTHAHIFIILITCTQ